MIEIFKFILDKEIYFQRYVPKRVTYFSTASNISSNYLLDAKIHTIHVFCRIPAFVTPEKQQCPHVTKLT